MSQDTDALLRKWREDVKLLQSKVAHLSEPPQMVHHTTQDGPANEAVVAVLKGQIAELKHRIQEREDRFA